MTTRMETFEQYLSVCKIHKKETSQLIESIFDNETQTEPVVK